MRVWAEIAAGAFPLEAQVSSHLVVPLLDHVLHGTALSHRREYRAGRGSVDFAVLNGEQPVSVVEVKLTINAPASGDWSTSKDFQQLLAYMNTLGVPGALIDTHRVLLVHCDATQPHEDIARRSITSRQLQIIAEHLAGHAKPIKGSLVRDGLRRRGLLRKISPLAAGPSSGRAVASAGVQRLVLVESPSKSDAMASMLGEGYVVQAVSPSLQLPPGGVSRSTLSQLPWLGEVKSSRHAMEAAQLRDGPLGLQLRKLRSLLRHADELYLATEEGWRGRPSPRT